MCATQRCSSSVFFFFWVNFIWAQLTQPHTHSCSSRFSVCVGLIVTTNCDTEFHGRFKGSVGQRRGQEVKVDFVVNQKSELRPHRHQPLSSGHCHPSFSSSSSSLLLLSGAALLFLLLSVPPPPFLRPRAPSPLASSRFDHRSSIPAPVFKERESLPSLYGCQRLQCFLLPLIFPFSTLFFLLLLLTSFPSEQQCCNNVCAWCACVLVKNHFKRCSFSDRSEHILHQNQKLYFILIIHQVLCSFNKLMREQRM